MQDLGKDLGYIGEPCPNCGRVRVIAYSGGKHICQKCNWCVEDKTYIDWDDYEYIEDEASEGLWRAMGGELNHEHT